MSVVVVATIVPKPEFRAQVISAFEAVISEVHAEPGCELYALHETADNLVMIEKWSSQEDLDRHSSGPALAGMRPVMAEMLLTRPDVRVLQPHPAGRAELGAL
jgi:quinol monooxygenase YgiN